MKKLENYLIWFTLLGGSSLDASSAPDSKGGTALTGVKTPDAPVSSKEQTLGYLESYGHLVTSNANVHGLWFDNEEEKNAFLKGVKDCMDGKPQPSNLDKEWQNIETLLFQREQKRLENTKKEGEAFLKKQASEPGYCKTESGLVYKVITPGDTVRSTGTSVVKLTYEGKNNGVTFDSGEEVEVCLADTILGFTEAVSLVGQGGKVHIFVPSLLGYGDLSYGPILAGSVLEFSITVQRVIETPAPATTSAPASAK
jgi:FKBP-type peptidyl-prolyl cis-trans isomerase FkpA/FKBP-type peptidyl-prolyl cis-trans isomerase FklB